mgnify:FL=1
MRIQDDAGGSFHKYEPGKVPRISYHDFLFFFRTSQGMKKLILLIISLYLFSGLTPAQILTIAPENPTADSSIVLVYDATQGNGELAGYTGDVYMHTGVITIESAHPGDWKYVVSDWCENTPETKMVSLGNDLYQAQFHIRSFYGIPESEVALQLAFLFRSEDCTLVGRDENNGDIFYPLAYDISTTSYESHELTNDSLIVQCADGEIIVTPYNPNILNVFSGSQGVANMQSHSVVAEKEIVSTEFSEEDHLLKFSTDSLELVIDTTDLSFRFIYGNDTALTFLRIYDFGEPGVLVSELKEGERIYGTGSRAIDIDRRGRFLAVNNQAQYGYGLGAENLNITLPVLSSSENYMLFYDNHSLATLDIGAMNGDRLSCIFSNGQADLFVIAGNDHGELVRNHSFLTGRQPMPPLWTLGYIQSKFGYENQPAAYNIVNQLITADFPLDALVLDLYWFGDPGDMGNLDWDHSRFPDPVTMMSDFSEAGVKTVLITEPYFTLESDNYGYLDAQGYFGQDPSGETYVLDGFWAGSAALLDLFHPEVPLWFSQFYTDRTNEGVAGWWTDLGEPQDHPADMIHYGGMTASEIHNVYALEWERIIFENWQTHFPDERLFNLCRSGFTGMQRYSTFPWSGDVQRSYEGLQAQVPIMLSMGLSGIPWMHSDVGGFTGGGNDDELFVRWVQMGVFAPVFRIHGAGIETAPTAYGFNARNIARKYIKLRYELLPYNYTLAWEASSTGLPLARPMDFYDIGNAEAQNINDQYFWGDAFIVAPVMHQGQNQRSVYLPEGKWLDYHTLSDHTGPGNFIMPAPLEDIPVLVKAGSFVPTVRGLQTTDHYLADTLFIQYFPDAVHSASQYTLFDDDKTSPNSLANGQFCLITINGLYGDEEITIDLSCNGQAYPSMPGQRQFIFEIRRIAGTPGSVTWDAAGVIEHASLDELLDQPLGYFFDQDNNSLFVNVPYLHGDNTLKIQNVEVSDIDRNESNIAKYSVYPNPGNGFLFITGQKLHEGSIRVSISDLSGKTVKETDITFSGETRIITEDLKTGVYLIHIHDNENRTVLKWVKQ